MVLVGVLLLSSMACNFARRAVISPTPTPVPVQVTPLSPATLVSTLEAAATAFKENKPVTLSVTEADINSLAASKLEEMGEEMIQDPYVSLRDGKIIVTGKVTQSGITFDATISVVPAVTADGRLSLSIESARISSFPVPDSMLESLSSELDNLMNSNLGSDLDKVFIEKIEIINGTITVTGRPR
jgi:uncharacterized protein YpmS